jgi:hypothetical protein
MTTTKKGLELARKLAPAIGYTNAIDETCSKICRAAATLHRLNEEACNGHPLQGSASNDPAFWQRVDKLQAKWEERVERETERILKRLDSLVRDLPETDFGPFVLDAESDPRGCSVIIAPEGAEVRRDSWGDSNGVCIP